MKENLTPSDSTGKRPRYCVATDERFVAHPNGKGLGWTYDLEEAKRTALSVGGRVYDAEAFAALPDATQHRPIFDGSRA
jgi:hypothetical protein